MYTLSQAQIFILFFVLGLSIGLFFDFFRVLRKSFKTTNFITYIEDIIFMAITGILIVNALIVLNNGELRFFIILALLIGSVFYFLTISQICFKLFYFVIKIFKKIVFFPIFLQKSRKK